MFGYEFDNFFIDFVCIVVEFLIFDRVEEWIDSWLELMFFGWWCCDVELVIENGSGGISGKSYWIDFFEVIGVVVVVF